MVKQTCYMVLAFIAVVAVGGLIWSFTPSTTGSYTAGGSGRYIVQPNFVQLSPQDACQMAGCMPKSPLTVSKNDFGVYQADCICAEGLRSVPLVQVVKV